MGIGELIDRLRKLNEITIDGIVYVEKIDLDYLIGEQVNNSKYFNVGDRVRVIAHIIMLQYLIDRNRFQILNQLTVFINLITGKK